jgi:hypothetical protein
MPISDSKAQPVTLTNSGAGVLKINHINVTQQPRTRRKLHDQR